MSDGDKFDGICCVPTLDATAWVTDACSAESCDAGEVVVGAVLAVLAVESGELVDDAGPSASACAARPLPMRLGSDALTTNVHASANAVSPAPTARDRPARRVKRGE